MMNLLFIALLLASFAALGDAIEVADDVAADLRTVWGPIVSPILLAVLAELSDAFDVPVVVRDVVSVLRSKILVGINYKDKFRFLEQELGDCSRTNIGTIEYLTDKYLPMFQGMEEWRELLRIASAYPTMERLIVRRNQQRMRDVCKRSIKRAEVLEVLCGQQTLLQVMGYYEMTMPPDLRDWVLVYAGTCCLIPDLPSLAALNGCFLRYFYQRSSTASLRHVHEDVSRNHDDSSLRPPQLSPFRIQRQHYR